MKNILLLDNYDSFTYNVVYYIEDILDYSITVVKNDKISLKEVDNYDIIILSPGPGLPKEAGILLPLIKEYAGKKPILGICLGLQAIVESFLGELMNLNEVVHGIATKVNVIEKDILFENLPNSFLVGRYHSWVADTSTLPNCFTITCEDEHQNIMAITHNEFFIKAVQFHPESILTPNGKQILENFLQAAVNHN